MTSHAKGSKQHLMVFVFPEIGGVNQVALRDKVKTTQNPFVTFTARCNALRHTQVNSLYVSGIKIALCNSRIP
jgi:hypothetical protein